MIRRLLTIAAIALLAPALAAAADKPRATKAAAPRPAKADSVQQPIEHGDPSQGRRLQDIHIEGEIPVPQVLFITAREQRRVLDFDHQRYRRSSVELARGTAVPKKVTVAKAKPAPPAEAAK